MVFFFRPRAIAAIAVLTNRVNRAAIGCEAHPEAPDRVQEPI
jgi:hypothetical protein